MSRKKSQIGCINKGFNFLGVHYLPTRMEDNTTAAHAKNDKIINFDADSILFKSITGQVLFMNGGG